MADKIKVVFKRVYVKNDEDWLGDGEFYFIASVDGNKVGNSDIDYTAVEGKWIDLPEALWSREVDVTPPKASVVVRFKGKERDLLWDDDLGPELVYTLKPPWQEGPRLPHETDDYKLEWEVKLFADGTYNAHPPDTVFACRSAAGATVCTTVSGTQLTARMEIHPVVPVVSDAPVPVGGTAVFPPRPAFPAATGPAKQNPTNGGVPAVAPGDPINVLRNPSVIPILSAPPPAAAPAAGSPPAADATNAARIEYTWYRPASLNFTDNDARLEWTAVSVAGGATVGFVGPATGTKVLVYGKTAGEVRLEVRFRGALFAVYRALVRPMKRIACRFNILNGPNAASTPASTPADVLNHLAIANRFLRQIALELVLDTNVTVTNNAHPVPGNPGIFRINVPAARTRNIPNAFNSISTQLNYRPNIVNFAYVRSCASHSVLGAATDYPANGAGATITDSGSPSCSWNTPGSGVDPDTAAGTLTMKLLAATAAIAGKPNVVGMFVSGDNGSPSTAAMTYATTIAHEFGHILNLMHRVDSTVGATYDDGLNHPPGENLMHWSNPATIAQDLDIIQARAAHQTPLPNAP
ncbi:MAG TPA: hypothetical protein VGL09_08305 [Methylomirabilota bacterium]